MSERCGRSPIQLHCHGCGHGWTIGFDLQPLADFLAQLNGAKPCAKCGSEEVRFGPPCETVVERAKS